MIRNHNVIAYPIITYLSDSFGYWVLLNGIVDAITLRPLEFEKPL